MKVVASFLWGLVVSVLPCPDLASRYRMRREAYRLVTLRTWPGMTADSSEAAQLAMLRLLWLQRQTHRAVRGRHKEASAMLARASVRRDCSWAFTVSAFLGQSPSCTLTTSRHSATGLHILRKPILRPRK